ncbi:MAG: helix-turn-helix domain-containing protein [Bacilli bacterium]
MVLEQEIWSEERLLELLKIDKNQLARLVRDEKLPVVRLGNSRAFLAESVLKWMKERESVGKWEGRGRKANEDKMS